MNTEYILKADLLDLLFYNRNKLYGAYELQIHYAWRVKTALMLLFSGILLFSIIQLLPGKKSLLPILTVSDGYLLKQLQPDKKMLEPKPKSAATKTTSQAKFNKAIVLVSQQDKPDSLQDISLLAIGSRNIINVSGTHIGDPPPFDFIEKGNLPALPKPVIAENNIPVDHPDVQATYPGGDKELIRFLQNNLKNPEELEGTESVLVKVKFVVGFDGNLKEFNIIKDGGILFNEEVLRVLKKMPRWNPGKMGGQNVPVYYTIPVRFTVTE